LEEAYVSESELSLGDWRVAVRGEVKVEEDLSPVGPEVFAVIEDVSPRVWFQAEWAALLATTLM